jgi:trehalose 6-phosphate phosphatase
MSRPLFEAIAEVGGRIERAPELLICLDFDGTLTPLQDEPSQVSLTPHMQRALRGLTEQPGLYLAVISGRERADLQSRLRMPGLIYAGNHGLEISGEGILFIEPNAAASSDLIKAFAEELRGRLQGIPGAIVENKGLTLSIHYRMVAESDAEQVRKLLHAALAGTDHPFQLACGNKVYDIRPRVYWNKGSAVGWIKEQLGKPDLLVVYVGDDVTDEDAFAALPDGITVKVGDPGETVAQYHLENPAEVRKFLEWLAEVWPQRRGQGSGIKGQQSRVRS